MKPVRAGARPTPADPRRLTGDLRRPAVICNFTLLIVASLACTTVTTALRGTPTPLPSATPTLTLTASATFTASPTAPPTATGTATPFPTLTLQPSPTLPQVTNTPDAARTRQHLRIFERLWSTVNTRYVYPDFNGHDWQAVGEEYRARVETGLTDEDFYLVMGEMIASLEDEHSGFESPDEVAESERALAGDNDYAGIGVIITAHPEKGYASVVVTFENSPARQAGLQPHDRILAVDGLSLLGADGQLHTERVRGQVGSEVTLAVQTPGGPLREVRLQRAQITGAVPIDHWLVPGTRIAYFLIPTLFDETIADQVRTALDALGRQGALEGVILDNRQNDGGATSEGEELLGLFTQGVVGVFRGRASERAVHIFASDVAGSQTVPLAVLVGPGTVSYGEISSGVLQDLGRAIIVGETTLGNVEVLWPFDFEGGSRAWIAVERFDPAVSHADWEATGIVPDIVAPAEWDEIRGADDPGVQAAVEALQNSS
jgi:C-terminal peptidase prc